MNNRIVALSFYLMSTISTAATWTEVQNSGRPIAGLKHVVVDSESITVDKEITSLWFKMIYNDGRYVRYYAQYDCKRRLMRNRGTLFSADGLKQTELAGAGVVGPVVPETPSESVFRAVCKPSQGDAFVDQSWPAFPK